MSGIEKSVITSLSAQIDYLGNSPPVGLVADNCFDPADHREGVIWLLNPVKWISGFAPLYRLCIGMSGCKYRAYAVGLIKFEGYIHPIPRSIQSNVHHYEMRLGRRSKPDGVIACRRGA